MQIELMNKYVSNKVLAAVKIQCIELVDDIIYIHPAEDGFGPFQVSRSYLRKWKPQVGDYYIRTSSDNESYMSASEFESEFVFSEEETLKDRLV